MPFVRRRIGLGESFAFDWKRLADREQSVFKAGHDPRREFMNVFVPAVDAEIGEHHQFIMRKRGIVVTGDG
jgi:hypothetical protein